jgi:hypothetical protein
MAAVRTGECVALASAQQPTAAALLARIGRIHLGQRQPRRLRVVGDGRADGGVLPPRQAAAQRYPTRELAVGLRDLHGLEHQYRIIPHLSKIPQSDSTLSPMWPSLTTADGEKVSSKRGHIGPNVVRLMMKVKVPTILRR